MFYPGGGGGRGSSRVIFGNGAVCKNRIAKLYGDELKKTNYLHFPLFEEKNQESSRF